MTSLTIYDDSAPHAERARLADHGDIAARLVPTGVRLERWHVDAPPAATATDDEILAAYAGDVARLQAMGGYASCDIVRLTPDHPQRAALRAKFLVEHIHDDDEVRFFVEGAGVFYIRAGGTVHALECTAGDLIVVPAGTRHWFDAGERPRFTAIRLFITPEGWVARYTGDEIARAIPAYQNGAAA